jgi:hypothetical protein
MMNYHTIVGNAVKHALHQKTAGAIMRAAGE